MRNTESAAFGPTLWTRLCRSGGRLIAAIAATASDARTMPAFIAGFILVHAVIWTIILALLKVAQDIHFDTSEAYAWGQQFLLGYGKHPPMSGWIAGFWFRLAPPSDIAAYGLAMATIGFALFICWRIALHVVDNRRAVLSVVLLALYPIFNFKGYKYNADLAQLATLPLIVLAYLHAFEKRSTMSGVWLGLAACAGVMTKYWALTMIGAVGLAALLHPQRLAFLRSPAPWVAMVVFALAMLPHLVWLWQVDFAPFAYAGAFYSSPAHGSALKSAMSFLSHNLGLLLPAILVGVIVLATRAPCARRWWWPEWLRNGPPHDRVNRHQAFNIWIIQIAVVAAPMIGGSLMSIHMKSDWGIPLFFLAPLALLAIPLIKVRKITIVGALAAWLIATLATLALAPTLARQSFDNATPGTAAFVSSSGLARQLTEMWHARFQSRWPAVVSFTEATSPMAFYSIDHPVPFGFDEKWSAGLITLEDARRQGFIGICDASDPRLATCMEWMHDHAAGAERVDITQRRFFNGKPGPKGLWHVFFVPPAPK